MIVTETNNGGDVIIYDQGGNDADLSAWGLLFSSKLPDTCWMLVFFFFLMYGEEVGRFRF